MTAIDAAILKSRAWRAKQALRRLNSSIRWRGRLERLSAFPTAVKNHQLDAWQLRLPGV